MPWKSDLYMIGLDCYQVDVPMLFCVPEHLIKANTY